jgi:2-keto-4-pentenoate hydratase
MNAAADPAAVASFLEARAHRPRWTGVPDAHRPASIDDAYRVLRAVHEQIEARGDRRVGYKIGSVSAAGQQLYGLAEPVYAGMFESGRFASIFEALSAPLVTPMVECEIAFVLAEGIGPTWSAADGLDAIARCHIACEIIDNRYGEPLSVGVPSLLADDFFHVGFVLGPENPDWKRLALGRLDAEVEVDGEHFRANSAEVLSATDALAWLADKLAQAGRSLEAGDIVLTGAIVPPVPIRSPPPQALSFSIEGFPPMDLGRAG